MPPSGSPRVVLACPGLDHVHRGFETFARECFDALRARDELDIELVKGTGARLSGEVTVPTLTRDSYLARRLARPWKREPFVVEHIAFSLALIPLVARRRPDIVYFSEWHLGLVLSAWRRISRQPVRLVFCNGAFAPGGYDHLDLVQQLVPGAIEFTAARGEPTDRQLMLPLGARIRSELTVPGAEDRRALRHRLALPTDRRIVLSAGALNRGHKRIDYVIEELARLPEPRPYLLLLGQGEADTPGLRELAAARLGPTGHAMRTVSPEAMAEYYLSSDAFVLGSLWESFGRALVEAQAHGLPCLAHEHPVMRWVLGQEGQTADLSRPGKIGDWLLSSSSQDLSAVARARRHRHAYERFAWDRLGASYVEMLRKVAEAPPRLG